MRRVSFEEMNCSIAQTLESVGEWWTLLIIRDLFGFKDLHKFEEIQADLGIARNVLTERLNRLVENEIVERRQYQTRPDRFEYYLTDKGKDLFPVVLTLIAWGDKYGEWPDGAPVKLRHTECGHDTTAQVCCEKCGEPMTLANTRSRAAAWLKTR
jgi:DNA-binding HxlR family transcriptional regulator